MPGPPDLQSRRYAYCENSKLIFGCLKPICTAPSVEATGITPETFASSEVGKRSPAAVDAWRRDRIEFVPLLAMPAAIGGMVYAINAIESVNSQPRIVPKTRSQLANDELAYTLLVLAIYDIEVRTTNRWNRKEEELLKCGSNVQHETEA